MISDEELEALEKASLPPTVWYRLIDRLRSAEEALKACCYCDPDGIAGKCESCAHFEKVKGNKPSCGSDFDGDDV